MEVKTLVSAPAKLKNEDYSTMLRVRNLKYKEADQYYWQVGNIKATQGWIIHVSVVKTQIKQLLTTVLPELIQARLPFKIIRDHRTANLLLNANFGYERVGKILSVYPENEEAANAIADKLIALTAPFKGPAVPTDARLAGNVYARYGSFNPILINNEFGLPERHIKDSQGNLVKDVYTIPFALPKGVSWPFKNAKQPTPKTLQVFNNTYLVIKELKNDAKGRVFKTYQVKNWTIKTTVLKEARHDAGTDDQDRDVVDRLKWQYELHCKLRNSNILLPKAYGFFQEDGNSYFAMEFISGKSINEVIHHLVDRSAWVDVPLASKSMILAYLLELLGIIHNLHTLGYVHRDISPANFIVNKHDKLTLIDLEGTYSIHEQQPDPPFFLGTPGFTAPEQNMRNYATPKEDIYSIGALIFTFFTGLSPAKFLTDHPERIQGNLLAYRLDDVVNQLIVKCLDPLPEQRPELLDVISEIAHYKLTLNTKSGAGQEFSLADPDPTDIQNGVAKGINAFDSDIMAEPGKPWHFTPAEETTTIMNRQSTKAVYAGLANGISGGIYVLSKAKQAGIKINSALGAFSRNMKFLEEITAGKLDALSPGLFEGSAGIAVALASAAESRLTTATSSLRQRIMLCLDRDTNDLTFANGLAGQIVAILHCRDVLTAEQVEQYLHKKLDALLKAQKSNGEWPVKEKTKITGLSEGIAGITLALLASYCYLPDETVAEKIQKALRALNSRMTEILDRNGQAINKEKTISTALSEGLSGTALCYLEVYRVFQDQSYREMADRLLLYICQHIHQDNLSLGKGMAGVGHVLLEATEVLETTKFTATINIVTTILQGARYESKQLAYWNVKDGKIQSVSLLEGGGGPVHYLLRVANPGQITMPIFNYRLFQKGTSTSIKPL